MFALFGRNLKACLWLFTCVQLLTSPRGYAVTSVGANWYKGLFAMLLLYFRVAFWLLAVDSVMARVMPLCWYSLLFEGAVY